MEAKKLRIIIDELSKFCGMVQEEEVQKLADEVKTANIKSVSRILISFFVYHVREV